MMHLVAHIDVDGIMCHSIAEIWARESGIATRHYFVDYQDIRMALRKLSMAIGSEDEVLVADIGYSKDLVDFFFNRYGELASRVSWFDHHRWDKEASAKASLTMKEFVVDERFCAAEILQRRFLPKDEAARRLALLARAHDFCDEGSGQGVFDYACRIQDVITSGYPKEVIVDYLSRGAVWPGSFDVAYKRYQEVKADAMRMMDETVERYCLSIDSVSINIVLSFAQDTLEAKDAKRHLLKENECDAVIILWPDGRIAHEVVSQKFTAVSQKINSNFRGGGRGLVGGATYPQSVSLENRKQCFDRIIEAIEG